MNPTLFIRVIKAGKTEDVKKFISECTTTKQNEYKDLLLRYGLNNVRFWFQAINNTDYMLFTHDIDDDAMEKLAGWETSTHPFDQWFQQGLADCFDLDNEPEQPAFYTYFNAHQ
ncbi:MAG: hypothetical protein P1U63_02095 [Coxiellaceae bacterium]|nr:hypothetical protein [Coxiellaceae bacterium]